MITGIRHIGYGCHDLQTIRVFYEDYLCWEKIWQKSEDIRLRWGIKDGPLVTTIKYQAPDGSVVELIHQTPELYHINFNHVCLVTDNMEADYRRLSGEDGWYFISRPTLSPDGDCKVAMFVGPDGGTIELVEVIKEWMPTKKEAYEYASTKL